MKKEELAYYLNDDPIVSDREWDSQFDELAALEGSINYEVVCGSPSGCPGST